MSDETNDQPQNPIAPIGAAVSAMFSPTMLAALRNALSGLGVLLGMIGFAGLLPAETIQKIIDIAQQIGVAVGAFVALVGMATPLIMGAIAAFKSTQAQQIKRVRDIASGADGPVAEEAKQTLVDATIGLDNVQTIVTDKKTAEASPSASVVSAEDVNVTQIGGSIVK